VKRKQKIEIQVMSPRGDLACDRARRLIQRLGPGSIGAQGLAGRQRKMVEEILDSFLPRRDWMKDPARGGPPVPAVLWIDMLSLMFRGARRGCLQFNNGKTVTAENLARMTGNSTGVNIWLQELQTSGVYSSTDDGVIYSRRLPEYRDSPNAQMGGSG